MKKLVIALSAVMLTLPAAMCEKPINSAGSVATAVSQSELDRAYVDFGNLLDRVRAAREAGVLVPGSPKAITIANDIAVTRGALARNDLTSARAAMARIRAQL